MEKLKVLREAGIDYEAGVARFMGDSALYEKVLRAFPKGDVLTRAQTAFEQGDRPAFRACVHEIKGSSGNADMEDLYAAASTLMELLRHDESPEEEIATRFHELESAYTKADKGIREALGED